MPNKIIIIGVGSTGLSIMEHAERFYYEFTKSVIPQNVKMMFIETDVNRKAKRPPNGKESKIEACYIRPDNINASLSSWHSRNNAEWSWLPSNGDVLKMGVGAGGSSVFGRAALWANYGNLQNAVNNLFVDGDQNTKIYIVGSFSGGTGSGIFLDVAYMVRKITTTSHIYGQFVLPNSARQVDQNIYFNTYASLRSLDKYTRAGIGNFVCNVPVGNATRPISSDDRPFEWVQFMTTDFSNGNASMTFPQLEQSAGMNLVFRLLDFDYTNAPFIDLLNRRLVDYATHNKNTTFTVPGFVVYQYPESLLEEYFACVEIERSLLNRWQDKTDYIDTEGSTHSIDSTKTRIKVNVRRRVERIIEEVIASSRQEKGAETSSQNQDVALEVERLISGNGIEGDKKIYLNKLFAETQTDKFYASIHGHEVDLRDKVVDKILDYVKEETDRYQNLSITEMLVEEIADYIQKLVEHWGKKYKIDGTTAKWNATWKKMYESRFSGSLPYTSLFCKREWLTEAISGVVDICYYNTLIPQLNNIVSAMLGKSGATRITSNKSRKGLPSLADVKRCIDRVTQLLDPKGENSVVARKEHLADMLSNQTNPQIVYLFDGMNTYIDEFERANSKYANKGGDKFSFSKVSKDSLWEYLSVNDADKIKVEMTASCLDFIGGLSLFGDRDIHSLLRGIPQGHPCYDKVQCFVSGNLDAKRSTIVPAMVRLNPDLNFQSNDRLNLITLTELDANNDTNVVKSFSQECRPNNDNYATIHSLKNSVVLYQVYNMINPIGTLSRHFNPLIHIEGQDSVYTDLRDAIENKSYKPNERLAYIDEKTLMDLDNIAIV